MLSLAALARRLDLPYPRAVALVKAGTLKPKVTGPNNTKLFAVDAVEKFREHLAAEILGGCIQ